MNTKYLLYIGVGWDAIFDELPEYDKYIMVDALPNNNHFPKGCLGHKYCKNKWALYKSLCHFLGKSDNGIQSPIWTWGNGKYEYHYNTDCKDFTFDKKCDMLLKGYIPSNLDKYDVGTFYLHNDTVFENEIYEKDNIVEYGEESKYYDDLFLDYN